MLSGMPYGIGAFPSLLLFFDIYLLLTQGERLRASTSGRKDRDDEAAGSPPL
jgi:hypothetical protein